MKNRKCHRVEVNGKNFCTKYEAAASLAKEGKSFDSIAYKVYGNTKDPYTNLNNSFNYIYCYYPELLKGVDRPKPAPRETQPVVKTRSTTSRSKITKTMIVAAIRNEINAKAQKKVFKVYMSLPTEERYAIIDSL